MAKEREGNFDDVFDGYLLSEDLPLYPKSTPLYRVTITTKYISWEPASTEKHASTTSVRRRSSIKGRRSSSLQSVSEDSNSSGVREAIIQKGGLFLNMTDIVGCDCMKGNSAGDKAAYMTIYAYPHKKKIASRRTVRKRETLTLMFKSRETYNENMKEASKWKIVLQCLVKRVRIHDVSDVSKLAIPTPKKLLFLVNPFGGQGKAHQLFQQRVVPFLAEAAVPYEMKITEYANHAKEMMATLDTTTWAGVIAVSGDGLIHEIVNGLMSREDWEEAMKMPIGTIPGGSGNALACALSYHAGEPYLDNHVFHASFDLVKNHVTPMDLVAIDTCHGERIFSFLSCCWGLMADIDIESEKYRSMGEARFTIGTIARVINLRKYHGKVSFLPCEKYTPPSSKKSMKRSQSVKVTTPTASSTSGVPQRSVSLIDTPGAGGVAQRSVSLIDTAGMAGDVDQNSLTQQEEINEKLEKVEISVTEEINDHVNRQNVSAIPGHHVETHLLNPIDQPVPEDWVTLEGEFVNVAIIYQSHLAKDLVPAPESQIDGGVMYLLVVKACISRFKLLQSFAAMQEGKFRGSDDAEMITVRAFRFAPVEKDGIMTCDGERIPYGTVQGQILPSVAKIMCPKQIM